jgi:hypothetical protein
VIDGFDTLDALERCPVNEKHRPLSELRLRSITIHANPLAVRRAAPPTPVLPVSLWGASPVSTSHIPSPAVAQDQMIVFPSANAPPDIQG